MTDPFSRDNEQETVPRSAAAEFAVRPLPLGHRLGELQLDEVLGVGGFGIVYRAFDRTLRRAVAIKEYMPSMLATRGGDYTVSLRSVRFAQAFDAGRSAFLNEARLLAQFDHPGLVKVLHFWESHGTAYMVMPFYEGRTLKQLLDGGAQMGETQLRHIVAALLGALDTLHRAQCFHRDIALDNILIRPDGNPILLDFGAARKRIGDLVDDSAMMIKPGYAPIEQYTDDPAFGQGPWTDLYALGAVLHAMVTGELPPAAVVRSIQDTYRPLATRELSAREPYSPAFLAAIDHALRLKIADRPESVAEFAAELGLRELDRAPYAAPMPAGSAQAQPQPQPQPRSSEPEGDRGAGAARTGEPPAAAGSPDAHRRDDAGVGAAENADATRFDGGGERAGPSRQTSRQPASHRREDPVSAAAGRAGEDSGASAVPHRRDDDERGEPTMSAQGGAQRAQTPSHRQASARDASAVRPDAEAAASSSRPRPSDDRDAEPLQPRADHAPSSSSSSRDGGVPPPGAGDRHVSDAPGARAAAGVSAASAAGTADAAGAGAGVSKAFASSGASAASVASAASAASRPAAHAARLGHVRMRLRDRRTIAYAGGALAVSLAIGIGVAYLVKPSGRTETTAADALAPPSLAATPAPMPGGASATAALAQRGEPQPALAPPPAPADMTAHEPEPTVATTVAGASAAPALPSPQPASPQIANNDAGAVSAHGAPASNLAPKGSLDATETVIANPSASGGAPPVSPSVAEEAAAAAAADQRPPDMQETVPVRFHVRPWGDVYVSGVKRGASPPLRTLSLAPGVYQIEIRNGALPPLRRTVKIDPGSKPVSIDYAFE
ncbi:protein kinase [Burkholderia thailandensis]|uniref:serine/threonine protein kinase n=2 Tax=Burkholderia thailandensis TaxID=57975 RepID=UPI000CB234AB|nr:serine/threonine protein kinase [Burkholderia thailandensis]MCS3392442.1 protein kinase [Burkholderia thailandensis]MCS6425277.1 protein kinase [Burkholderia thailandensis]MCS6453729.1 protein kinase [Burkholderia thailandensis]MCS6464757.1 protein kinase [Burkholderia thailandensis]MCS6482992.1 protein kinase [Burkholderia thailandensis]